MPKEIIQMMKALKAKVVNCQACKLCEKSDPVPFRGSVPSLVSFIGEAPEKQENETGIPFYQNAPSGKLLEKMLDKYKITNYTILNRVSCWPNVNGETTKPPQSALDACLPLFEEQIELFGSKILVPFGGYAAKYFDINKISERVGKAFVWKDKLVIPCYHPSYVLENGGENGKIFKEFELTFKKIKRACEIIQ